MKWGCRFLPLEHLEQRYLNDKSSFFGGIWYPSDHVREFEPTDLVRLLKLNYTRPNGNTVSQDGTFGAIHFPVTAEIRATTTLVQSQELGGRLPELPGVSVANGFAPGALLIPEFMLSYQELPQDSTLVQVLPGGQYELLARWKYRQWNRP